MSRLTNVVANGSAAASYAFDVVGNLRAMRYGNGVTNLHQYDSLNRLTNSVWKTNGVLIANFFYQLGRSGNRTNVRDSIVCCSAHDMPGAPANLVFINQPASQSEC